MKKVIIMAALLILLAGCGDKRINSSTNESFESSIAAVKSSLSKEKKKEFENAVQVLSFSEVGNLFAVMANPNGVRRKLRDRLAGKTADEIIAEAKRINPGQTKKEQITKQKFAPKGAFGIKFGDVYIPPQNKHNTEKSLNGEPVYFIDAPQKFRKFDRLGLLTTPKTHKIYEIRSSAKLKSAYAEKEIVLGLLSKKYKMEPEWSFGNWFHFETSSIYVDNYSDTLKIEYTDKKLAELAKKERLEIESKKSDNSAI